MQNGSEVVKNTSNNYCFVKKSHLSKKHSLSTNFLLSSRKGTKQKQANTGASMFWREGSSPGCEYIRKLNQLPHSPTCLLITPPAISETVKNITQITSFRFHRHFLPDTDGSTNPLFSFCGRSFYFWHVFRCLFSMWS